MPVRQLRSFAPARRPHDETFLNKKRLIDLLKSTLILPHSSRDGIRPHRSPLELGDDGPEYLVVYGIEPPLVYIKGIEGISGYLQVYVPVAYHLGEIPYPSEQGIRYTRRPAASERNLIGCIFLYAYAEYPRTPLYYIYKIIGVVIFQVRT